MRLLAGFLLLAAYHDVKVLDQTYQIPPNDWRYVDSKDWRYPAADWQDQPAIVSALFQVEAGPPARLLMMDRANLARLKRGESHEVLRGTPPVLSGIIQQRVGAPGDYVLVLWNPNPSRTAIARLTVSLDSWDATQLTAGRKLAVLAISFGVFFGLVGFSAIKLWRAANPRV
jgi:hypothetical protein